MTTNNCCDLPLHQDTGGLADLSRLKSTEIGARGSAVFALISPDAWTLKPRSSADDGTLLLAASHRRRTFVISFDVDESTEHVHPRWVLVRRGKLGLSPTLTNRGLTLPMKRHGKVENTFVPATDLHGGTHWGFGSCL